MSVDPLLAERLALIAGMAPVAHRALPPLETAALMRARQVPAAPADEPRLRIEDHAIRRLGGAIPIRIYRPAGEPPRGAVVNVHGGGWVVGGIDMDDGRCRRLALASGSVVVSVDYRLAPEHRFPAALEDCYATVVWASEAASAWGVGRDRVALLGSSAGGNLAAATTLRARDRGGPPIAFQILVYPACDPALDRASARENQAVDPLTVDLMRWFWEQYVPEPAERITPLAAPLRAADLGGLPPAHVITAEHDPLRDEGEAYAARLRDAGVPATVTRYAGMVHGFLAIAPDLPQAQAAEAEIAAAIVAAFPLPAQMAAMGR